MRKLFTLLLSVLLTASVFAQAPQKMSYQAVIRNTGGTLVTSTQIGMEINIRQGSPTGTVVYTETQTPTTNINGLVSIEIGGGTGFSTINWASDNFYIETKTAVVAPLTTYTITGASQLLSVPYALYAKSSGSTGDKGPTGDKGLTGDQGIPGIQGDKGITGDKGLQGDQGLQGDKGATGDKGLTGDKGATGDVGDKGLTGDKGATGDKGLTGDKGATGDAGDPAILFDNTQVLTTKTWTSSKIKDELDLKATTVSVTTALNTKVDKDGTKVLSTNDYTTAEQTKLAGIADGAEVNVQADWNQATTTADDYIKNKPTIPATADGSETKVTAGKNVSITGTGTTANPYKVNTIESMTQMHRDSLSATEGLFIYNTTTHKPNYYNGTEWMNYDGTSAKTLAIGVSHQGGIIFYIFQSGDLGYIEGQTHGLIAATSDQGTGVSWHESYTTVGAWATEIGTGSANTTLIISILGNTGTYAAKICRDYTGGGYNDWYLPSKNELFTLWQNKLAVGNLAFENYWSSSEGGQYLGCAQYFGIDVKQVLDKYQPHYVRAIRTF